MSAPSKKRALAEDKNVSGNEAEGDDEEDMEDDFWSGDDGDDLDEEEKQFINQEVQVEFEARNAEDSDFHGIRQLLQQVYLKANINLSELADMIIAQNYVGSVIKQVDVPEEDDSDSDDGDDVFGVISAINLTEKKDAESVRQLHSYLLGKCQACEQKQQQYFKALLEDPNKQVGYLVNERLINIPPQIATPMFQSLKKEMERAVKKKMKYSFDYFLMVAKTYKTKPSNQKKKGKNKTQTPDEITFLNPEEELFSEESVLSFDYSVASERDGVVGGQWDDEEEEFEPFRRVMFIPGDKLDSLIIKVQQTFGGS
ncbi:BRCA2 and CDKN1A-interacting protein [Lingula anatina]|uniref:Protein BCCIP homolog n=1 Tax=Lingula anatina TaxID=7574 RepID=A0A1S3KCT1_LINAN|nr:BRCA2 and CDKN1A-interacting protein [Lingula anatina]XP_013420439.1 BRCA2 and CDKN1A-interacting protein [Lingula anatina]|eukprot:XP_013420438.1 BRCA2 and CDKN1A-interacting protein [Lingula anatina]